jgi:hypothetical protein
MDNRGKWKPFTISDKINIFAQVDAYIGTHVELAPRLTLSSVHAKHYCEEP